MQVSAVRLFFRDSRHYRLFLILCLSTFFDCLLVLYRSYHLDFDWQLIQSFSDLKAHRGIQSTSLFLVWNLLLAWIPYWLSMSLNFYGRISQRPSPWSHGFLVLAWLLFFPNAPYILTDLLHLKYCQTMPHWYDVLMFLSFAWTGLLLGYASLFEVQYFLEQRFNRFVVWSFVVTAIWLGGFGVYMGRFQRWNSWDILTDPLSLISQQVHILRHPLHYMSTLGVAILLSGFMLIGYLTLSILRSPVEA
jgi:uncharacterized membrane protein